MVERKAKSDPRTRKIYRFGQNVASSANGAVTLTKTK